MDLQKKFSELYQDIIESEDVEKMKRLGRMTKRVMRWLIREEPELAETAIAMLDGEQTEAKNYLSEQEARAIEEKMDPQPTWTLPELEKTLEGMSLPTVEPPHFNRWALLTTMMMIQSDEGQELKNMMKVSSRDERLLVGIYNLAKARLTDKDGRFNIRKYFDL